MFAISKGLIITPESKKLVLASGSPRRRLLLAEAGYDFKVIVSNVDEPARSDDSIAPAKYAESLACLKADSVAAKLSSDCCVIAADTIVAMGNDIFGKPADAAAAREMLMRLTGRAQQVITGLAVVGPEGRRVICSCVSEVFMRAMSEVELDEYIASGLWQGKAGSYGIQDSDDHFVERIEGSFSNVVGLPMEIITEILGSPENWK